MKPLLIDSVKTTKKEDKMKGIYLLYNKIKRDMPTGIEKKILAQIECLRESGFECEEVLMEDGRDNMPSIVGKLATILPFFNVGPRWQLPPFVKKIQFIYFRRPHIITMHLRKFIKKVKKVNPNIKVVMEIPTYPYDLEYDTFVRKILLLKDRYNRRRLHGLVDRLAVISDKKPTSLWGVPVITFINGCVVASVEPRRKEPDDDIIHLGCVAMFMPWHGYERLLRGMIEYYNTGAKRNIIVHMVGEGEELIQYKRLAENPLLKDRVVFHGMLSAEALDSVYNRFDFGVLSLGVYKINSNVTSALKSREYLARGIPIIGACEVDVLQTGEMPYFLRFPNDSSNIDINRIVEFYDSRVSLEDAEAVTNSIRQFAMKTIDLRTTFSPIIEYLRLT